MRATAMQCNSRGVTTVDRATVAAERGCSIFTVTLHWRAATEAGLMRSKPRFDNSWIRYLGTALTRAEPYEGILRDLHPHTWVTSDYWWWLVPDKHKSVPPWGEGQPPF